jgi:hypothetical protein
MDRREVVGRPPEYRAAAAAAESEETPAHSLAQAIARGDFATAAQGYFALSPDQTRRVLSPEDSLALADWLQQNDHLRAALTVYRRHLRDYPGGPGAAEAHVGAGSVQLSSPSLTTSAYHHFLDALDLDPSPETAARARAGLDAIAGRQKFQIGRPRG